MSVLTTTIATLGTGVIATGATVVGVHATTDDPATSDPMPVACGAVWDRLPDQSQSDLDELRGMTPAERTAAAREMRRKAVAGTYGERAQVFAVHRQERRAQVGKLLPPAMRQDVRRLVDAAAHARTPRWADLRDPAHAGEYGPRVQGAAELSEPAAAYGPAPSGRSSQTRSRSRSSDTRTGRDPHRARRSPGLIAAPRTRPPIADSTAANG